MNKTGPMYARIEKTGSTVSALFSDDGKEWVTPEEYFGIDRSSAYDIRIHSEAISSFTRKDVLEIN